MTAQGFERIPDSLGYLVINDDGAVLSSGGDLENDEAIADKLMNLIQLANKVPLGVEGKPANLKRLSVVWDHFMYVSTISNHKVYVSKRKYVPHDPALA